MIITPRFIFLHLPKTAGTWVTNAIVQVHLLQTLLDHRWMRIIILPLRKLPVLFNLITKIVQGAITTPLSITKSDYLEKNSINRYVLIYGILSKILVKTGLIHKSYLIQQINSHVGYSQLLRNSELIPCFSCIRDPFSWHASLYYYFGRVEHSVGLLSKSQWIYIHNEVEFTQWLEVNVLEHTVYELQRNLKQINYLGRFETINSYKDISSIQLSGKHTKLYTPNYGIMTLRFIQMYFKQPWKILSLPPSEFDAYFTSGKYKQDLAPILFFEQENISSELPKYLSENGYSQEAISEINPRRINCSQNSLKKIEEVYTSPEQVNKVYQLERVIFQIFPHYKKIYERLLTVISNKSQNQSK